MFTLNSLLISTDVNISIVDRHLVVNEENEFSIEFFFSVRLIINKHCLTLFHES